MSVAAHIIS